MSLVTAENLEKIYQAGEVTVHAIRGVSFTIEPGAFVSFVGPSGSGKSTLLNMIGCLDPPTKGSLRVVGQDISRLDRKMAARFRGEYIGFVFQDFMNSPKLRNYINILPRNIKNIELNAFICFWTFRLDSSESISNNCVSHYFYFADNEEIEIYRQLIPSEEITTFYCLNISLIVKKILEMCAD